MPGPEVLCPVEPNRKTKRIKGYVQPVLTQQFHIGEFFQENQWEGEDDGDPGGTGTYEKELEVLGFLAKLVLYPFLKTSEIIRNRESGDVPKSGSDSS